MTSMFSMHIRIRLIHRLFGPLEQMIVAVVITGLGRSCLRVS
jgi:hypothetical protein